MLEITLANILDLLDDAVIAEIVDIPNDEARQCYPMERITVDSYQQYHEEITIYYIHHMQAVIGPPGLPPDMASGHARNLIERAFHRQGGYESAYRFARSGRNGGLGASLDAISQHFKEDQRERYIDHIFHTFIDHYNYEDHVELMRQYVERFGGFMPPEEVRRTPEDLARNYEELIKTHVQVINNIRSSMRRFT
jgi:hypothetical protein